MLKNLLGKLKESAISIIPVACIVLILYLIFFDFSLTTFIMFIISIMLMILGMSLFTLGVDIAMMKMGGHIGSSASKINNLALTLFCSFLVGFVLTIAEPDLNILAASFPGLKKWILIISVSLGVGIFLLLSSIKTIFKIPLNIILSICYILIAILCFFVDPSFLPISFDASGATTGAISVPFIMAFGLGICSVRSGKNNQEDGFGQIALASVGPILAVMIVSLFIKSPADAVQVIDPYATSQFADIGHYLIEYAKEILIVLLPIFAFFLIYELIFIKLPLHTLIRITIGLVYTYIGLLLFLTGVNSSFYNIGLGLGYMIVGKAHPLILALITVAVGFFMIFAEPSVHVLTKQVEDITSGVIKKIVILLSISTGVGIALLCAIIRNLLAIDFICFVLPFVLLALILSFFTPKIFVAIAFDSGGVASGVMATTFLLPFILGVSVSLGLPTLKFAFGTIALIALSPIIVIECLGIVYRIAVAKKERAEKEATTTKKAIRIIEFK
ncbi:MAG: DUF1538 domain-containing protein [Clostridia bacterium]|nr:DUF1538 domain-containing protein [Clostridia bacterium]